jgi:hypothetical protein
MRTRVDPSLYAPARPDASWHQGTGITSWTTGTVTLTAGPDRRLLLGLAALRRVTTLSQER